MSHGQANVFARVTAQPDERFSMIVTSNLTFGGCGNAFGDSVMMVAMLDRLVHHSIISQHQSRESLRLKRQGKAGLLGAPRAASVQISRDLEYRASFLVRATAMLIEKQRSTKPMTTSKPINSE